MPPSHHSFCHTPFWVSLCVDHPEDGFLELLEEMSRLTTTRGFQLTCSTEFHLSLSQTVVLRHHWIQPFVMSLQTGLAQCPRSVGLFQVPQAPLYLRIGGPVTIRPSALIRPSVLQGWSLSTVISLYLKIKEWIESKSIRRCLFYLLFGCLWHVLLSKL